MKLEIRPYDGVGPIRLGMSREEVRQALPVPAERFQKFPGAPPIDRVRNPSLMVHYDHEDICEAIEVAQPGEPTLMGQELLGRSFDHLRAWFNEQDPHLHVDGDGLISKKLGVGLYAPAAPNGPHSLVEGVIVFRHGYYDH
jgi:hypothetical protein